MSRGRYLNRKLGKIVGIVYTCHTLPDHLRAQMMDIQALYEQCKQEISDFLAGRSNNNDDEMCFDLMEIAMREDEELAITYVYRAYEGMLRRWVTGHSAFHNIGETEDYFMNVAFSNFYYAARSDQFDKFSSISKALAYLKACVHTAILQYRRSRKIDALAIDEIAPVPQRQDFDKTMQRERLWELLDGVLDRDDDKMLVRLVYSQGMKPAEVTEAYSGIWENARSVSVALQRIKRKLQGDEALRQFLLNNI